LAIIFFFIGCAVALTVLWRRNFFLFIMYLVVIMLCLWLFIFLVKPSCHGSLAVLLYRCYGDLVAWSCSPAASRCRRNNIHLTAHATGGVCSVRLALLTLTSTINLLPAGPITTCLLHDARVPPGNLVATITKHPAKPLASARKHKYLPQERTIFDFS